MSGAVFKLRVGNLPGHDAAKDFLKFWLILGMRSRAEGSANQGFRRITDGVQDALADVSKFALNVKDGDQIREIRDQAAHKILFAAQALLDLQALGDVHESPLQLDDMAGCVADGKSGGEAMDPLAVFAAKNQIAKIGRASCRERV